MDQPNYGHLGELLELLREEMRAGFAEIKRDLADRVSADVYAADKALTAERFDRQAAEITEMKDRQARAEDHRAADRRMVWSALIAGGLSLVVGAVLLALQLLAV